MSEHLQHIATVTLDVNLPDEWYANINKGVMCRISHDGEDIVANKSDYDAIRQDWFNGQYNCGLKIAQNGCYTFELVDNVALGQECKIEYVNEKTLETYWRTFVLEEENNFAITEQSKQRDYTPFPLDEFLAWLHQDFVEDGDYYSQGYYPRIMAKIEELRGGG